MKYPILILTFFSFTFCHAQLFENKKVLTTSLSSFNVISSSGEQTSGAAPNQNSNSFGFALRPEFTYGKVNEKNQLFAYGIGIEFSYNIQKQSDYGNIKNTRLAILPTVMFQKFIPIATNFYLTPAFRFKAGYADGRMKNEQTQLVQIAREIISTLSFNPASVTYSLNTKTNVVIFLGSVSLDYYYTSYDFKPNINNNKGHSAYLSFSGNVYNIGIGFQKIL